MKQFLLVLGIAFFVNSGSFAQDSLSLRSFLKDSIQVKLPKDFKELSQSKILERFPIPELRPFIVLTDPEEFTSFKVSKMSQPLFDHELDRYKDFHIRETKKRYDYEWLGDGTKQINGKKFAYYKCIDPEKGTFAYFLMTTFEGNLLLFTYNCVDKLWPALEETIEKIVNSVRVK